MLLGSVHVDIKGHVIVWVSKYVFPCYRVTVYMQLHFMIDEKVAGENGSSKSTNLGLHKDHAKHGLSLTFKF